MFSLSSASIGLLLINEEANVGQYFSRCLQYKKTMCQQKNNCIQSKLALGSSRKFVIDFIKRTQLNHGDSVSNLYRIGSRHVRALSAMIIDHAPAAVGLFRKPKKLCRRPIIADFRRPQI